MSYLCKSARVSGFIFLPFDIGRPLTRPLIDNGFFIMEDLRTPEEKKRWRSAVNVAWGIILVCLICVGAITVIRWIWDAI